MPATTPALNTLSLIGMPGAGKSTVGVILAKRTGLRFVDTDLDIQVREQATLQEILERNGYRYLREVEQAVLLAVELDGAVIATGGSAVYSEPVMRRLRAAGPVVYLDTPYEVLRQRVLAGPPRGIASDPGTGYAQVFAERTPLYRRHADITVATGELGMEQVASEVLARLKARYPDLV